MTVPEKLWSGFDPYPSCSWLPALATSLRQSFLLLIILQLHIASETVFERAGAVQSKCTVLIWFEAACSVLLDCNGCVLFLVQPPACVHTHLDQDVLVIICQTSIIRQANMNSVCRYGTL